MSEAKDIMDVLYATDRVVIGADGSLEFANGQHQDSNTYGLCTVALGLERSRGTDNPSTVLTVDRESEVDWATRVKNQRVLVFVHGFSNSFKDAVKKAACVKKDMPWEGPIVAFSWPSFGDGTKYIADETIYQLSLDAFTSTLGVLKSASEVHVLSHSMGNRVSSEALLQPQAQTPNLGQLIFAAADVDAKVFAQRLIELSGVGKGRTMYMSSMDQALEASALLHDDDRAGQVWPSSFAVDYTLRRPFVLVPGTDSIDCSGLNVGINVMHLNYDNHGYYAQPPALDDIRKVLSAMYPAMHRVSANGRGGLTAVHAQPNPLLGAIEALTGTAPPQVAPNATWYCLDPLAVDEPEQAPDAPEAPPQLPAVAQA